MNKITYAVLKLNPEILNNTPLILTCCQCDKEYQPRKAEVKRSLERNVKNNFCSRDCRNNSQVTSKLVICATCDKEFIKGLYQISKSENNFCSKSCAATLNNILYPKNTNNRSQLEILVEKSVKEAFPNLDVFFNTRMISRLDLDILIPSLKLAFELNGIYHYEAIGKKGAKKLQQTQHNDEMKLMECTNQGVELVVVNTYKEKNYKNYDSEYVDMILNKINQKISTMV